MPRTETVYRLLLASPGDLTEERAAVVEVVEELNHQLTSQHGVRLAVVAWEYDGVPGIGDDGQDVLNRTLPTDYDIFLGIMWTRLGTPTNRAPSGTVEEYDRALARYRSGEQNMHVMFYFKTADVPFDRLDPLQIQAVFEFRERVRSEGLAYEFSELTSFAGLLRVHLPKVVVQLHHNAPTVTTDLSTDGELSTSARGNGLGGDDEPGLFDLLDQHEEKVLNLGEIMGAMSSALDVLTANTRRHSDDLDKVAASGRSGQRSAVRPIIGQASRSMETYSNETERLLPEFEFALEDMLRSAGQIIPYFGDFSPSRAELDGSRETLLQLRHAMTGMVESMEGLTTTIAQQPRLTLQFNRAKRRSVETAKKVADAGRRGVKLLEQVEDAFRELEKSAQE